MTGKTYAELSRLDCIRFYAPYNQNIPATTKLIRERW